MKALRILRCAAAVTGIVFFGAVLGLIAQDDGDFLVHYDGPAALPGDPFPAITARTDGRAGFSVEGTWWANLGVEVRATLGELSLSAGARGGTDGVQVSLGGNTSISGFRVGGDATLGTATGTLLEVRASGQMGDLSLMGSAALAGTTPTFRVGVNTQRGEWGLSGTASLQGRAVSLSAGANTQLGPLSFSASAGYVQRGVSVGAGLGIALGPVKVYGNAGFDTTLGINASAGASLRTQVLDLSAVAMIDNTGVGVQGTAGLFVGRMQLLAQTRISLGNSSADIRLSTNVAQTDIALTVGLDSRRGFSWLEVTAARAL